MSTNSTDMLASPITSLRAYRGKRLFDLVVVLVTAPAWILVLAATAVVVRVKLGRPVLFAQRRPGLHGRSFTLRKFRTMTAARDGAGNLLPDHLRMTAVGRMLRSTSLDELPELLNVLRGDMSLVGPRPLLERYLPLYSPAHRLRHTVPPGTTGLAQVSGRNALSWSARLDLDVEYAKHNSFLMDLSILKRTASAVLFRRGISQPGEATMSAFTGYEPPADSAP